jgi:hypothetical protein
MVDQQLWGSDSDSSSSGSNLAAGAADDRGIAAWELNMKSLKTAAYDLRRLPNEVRTHACSMLFSGLSAETPIPRVVMHVCQKHLLKNILPA